MAKYYTFAIATDTKKSGRNDGFDTRILIRGGQILTPRGLENLRRITARQTTVFQIWGKTHAGKKKQSDTMLLAVSLSVYDLKMNVKHKRHVFVQEISESMKDGTVMSEETRILSPFETYKWLMKNHQKEFAGEFFPGMARKLSRKRINFNSLIFKFLVSPSNIFDSLLNIVIIALLLLLIPLIIIIVSVSMKIDDVGSLDRQPNAVAVFSTDTIRDTAQFD